MGHPDHGHKKLLLQKLMSNLLSKPGRSMHEMVNGVKSAISAYKNYSKEWDTLSGIGQAVGGAAMGAAMPAAGAAMGATGIRKILQDIQAKKGTDGSGGPGMPPKGNPNGMPSQAQGNPALGNPTRPSMPSQAQGTPALGNPTRPEMPSQAQGNPTRPEMPSMPSQAQGNPAMGVRPEMPSVPPQAQAVPPSPQPTRPPQMPSPVPPSSMPPAPTMVPSQMGNVPATGIPPVSSMPNLPNIDSLIAGQPQTSNFNRPAPVNNLGIFGR